MKLLFLNGPNLNMLGIREPDIYGTQTYAGLEQFIRGFCRELGITCELFQSNHEGEPRGLHPHQRGDSGRAEGGVPARSGSPSVRRIGQGALPAGVLRRDGLL